MRGRESERTRERKETEDKTWGTEAACADRCCEGQDAFVLVNGIAARGDAHARPHGIAGSHSNEAEPRQKEKQERAERSEDGDG